jgi:hypothetical protein
MNCRAITLLCTACFILTGVSQLQARFARPDLEKIPVERLAENISKQIAEDPKNAELQLNLARLYAMAYALKTDTAEINKNNKEQVKPWFGYVHQHVPFVVQKSDDKEIEQAAEKNLQLAIKHYEKAIELDEKNLTAALGLAWALDQSGKSMKAIDKYREIIEKAWEVEKELKSGGLMFQSVVAETARYLKAHLDETADAAEIAELDRRIDVIARIPRPITPIAIALSKSMTIDQIENRDASVSFDADGTGIRKQWSWISAEAGWLVYDGNEHKADRDLEDRKIVAGNDQIDSALQMFGSVSFYCFWRNGYHALAALDDNQDGSLTGHELDRIKIWRDANSNGISEAGEVLPLSAYKIERLNCTYQTLGSHAENIPHNQQGAITEDGSALATFDINLVQKSDNQN